MKTKKASPAKASSGKASKKAAKATPPRRVKNSVKPDPELFAALIDGVHQQIMDAMDKRKMSKSDLALAMDTSQPYISRLCSGSVNFSLASLLKIATALDKRLVVSIK